MTRFMRSLSALLAVVMVFTTMTVAFTVVSSAEAPYVPRVASSRLSPTIVLTVPEVIETWGSDSYEGGSNVKAIGQIEATITSHIENAAVEDISLLCSDAGISLSTRVVQGEGGSVWTIQGGTLKTAPRDDGMTVVKWTVSYNIGGQTYYTYAWSQVQPHYNNPGFAVHVKHQYKLFGLVTAARETRNHHVEWIQPVMGTPATDTATNYSQCYIIEGDGQHVSATGVYASSYYWDWDQGEGDDETHTSELTSKGSLYVDVSQKQDLSDVGLSSCAKVHHELADASEHPQYYRGTTITSQAINGNTTNAFSVTSPSDEVGVGVGEQQGDSFSGPLPAAGGTARINAQIGWKGQITRVAGISAKSYHITNCKYRIDIVTYDKTALLAAINSATAANYQQSQFRTTAPEDVGSSFRTWDQYMSALQNAWYIYGRKDVTQQQINAAISTLNEALPTYNQYTAEWQSGLMYADADYSRINTIRSTISDTLTPDFFEDYSDGTHGKYYQYTLASVLNNALEDIDYEYTHTGRLLDARFQGVVDQMRVNLSNAINALTETDQRKTTKLVSIEFDGNQTGVSNVPSPITTSLTGKFAEPQTTPERPYYEFIGWYYDAATTKRVTNWPLSININSPYFKANLDTKVDNAGVAYTLYAGWRLTGTLLSFDTQGGSTIAPAVGEEGAYYPGPTEVPTKTGNRFVGWCTDETLETFVDWNTFTFGSLSVVYAKWDKDSYTVTFNANGGAFADGTTFYSVTDKYGAHVETPLPPSQENVGFAGWFYDYNCTQEVDMSTFSIPDSNIQVFAKWESSKRNLILDLQNGSDIIVQTYATGYRINSLETPVKEGYRFKNWYKNPNGTGSPRSFPFSLSSNMTLYAVWIPLPYTVTFDPNGGVMPDSFNAADYEGLACGSVLTPPEVPTMPEYVFAGWTLDGEPYELTTVPARDITLVATWAEEPYVAQFRLRTDAGDTVEQGDIITATVSLTANRYVSNHKFVVYYDKRYLVPALNGEPVVTPISGTAACSKIANRAYFTLVRNPGGHNVTDCGTPTGRITPGNIARTDMFFPAEWTVDTRTLKEEYSQYEFVYFDAPDVSTNTRSRPTQEQDLASFQFLVLPNAPIADGVTDYAQILLSTDFVRTPENSSGNRTAACLQADATYSNVKDWDGTTNVVVDGDHRFAVSQMHACSVNFVTNGGNPIEPIEKKQGATVSLPTPTRDYYNFTGWTLTNDPDDTDYVNASAFEVPYASSVTLYARWTGKQVNYYVRHHKQTVDASGFMENPEQKTFKGTVGTTVTATPMDYDGFYCQNPNESGVVRGESSNALYLDLWYIRKTTSITLDANGGSFQSGQDRVVLSGRFDAEVTGVPANPTREGYTFAGWEQGTTVFNISKYPANDIEVTAKWLAKTITVRFFLDGSETPYSTMTGKYGDALDVPSVPVNPGQVFSGWKDSDGAPLTYTTFPAYDEDFYGTIGIDGYLLTLYVNGNQYGDPIEVLNGMTVTEASIGYSADPGFRFTGWRVGNSKDSALAQFPMTLTQNTSLYGFTEREIYSIRTYVYIDGVPEAGPSVNNLFYGMAFDLPQPDDYTDYGYGFRGWYTDPEMKTLYVKPDTMPAQNIVLYGEYYEMTGTIEFNLNGGTGTAPANITRALGETVNSMPGGSGFSKKLYKFAGWSDTPNGVNPITSYTFEEEGTVTFYAIWQANYVTVSFNLNGAESGTRPDSIAVEVGDTITAAELPSGEDFVRTGFVFSGWADKANATSAMASFTPTATGTKTLFAVWIANTATLAALEGSTAVIDEANGFVYGLDFDLTEEVLMSQYLTVIGNGYVQFDKPVLGTGTKITLINGYTGQEDASYTIVIFGDVDCDGTFTPNDVTQLRYMNANLVARPEAGTAEALAADVDHDEVFAGPNDYTQLRYAKAGLREVSQVSA